MEIRGIIDITVRKGVVRVFCVAICDDEEVVCGQIESFLEPLVAEGQVRTDVFYSGEKLYQELAKGRRYDLIFLDIEFEAMDGVELGRKIREELQDETIHIVYISAKQTYAMELFQIRPLNFLTKPLLQSKVIDNVEKAMRLSRRYNDSFVFHKNKQQYREFYGEILYFESKGRKIHIHTKRGTHEFYGKLNEIEEAAPNDFIRIHQSYLVNNTYVKKWTYEEAYLANGTKLSISQLYRKSARMKLLCQNTGNESEE